MSSGYAYAALKRSAHVNDASDVLRALRLHPARDIVEGPCHLITEFAPVVLGRKKQEE